MAGEQAPSQLLNDWQLLLKYDDCLTIFSNINRWISTKSADEWLTIFSKIKEVIKEIMATGTKMKNCDYLLNQKITKYAW